MGKLYKVYRQNINGVIFTLVFHITVILILVISQFRIKREYIENEMIIDFAESIEEEKPEQPLEQQQENISADQNQQTNIASNKSQKQAKSDRFFDQEYYNELAKAEKLAQNVSKQLSKDIPTISDLKMPETVQTEKQDSKPLNYTGDSNIEYQLDNRYHLRLPIPVYLAQKGGKVIVSISVDKNGNVISAEINQQAGLDDLILSYAKTAALRTKFNADSSAPNPQKGTIIYRFIAQ